SQCTAPLPYETASSNSSTCVCASQLVKHLICRTALASPGLCQSASDARHDVQLAGHLLIGLGIEHDSLGLTFHGKHQRTPGFLHLLHQTRGITLEGCQGMNVLGDIDHDAIIASY